MKTHGYRYLNIWMMSLEIGKQISGTYDNLNSLSALDIHLLFSSVSGSDIYSLTNISLVFPEKVLMYSAKNNRASSSRMIYGRNSLIRLLNFSSERTNIYLINWVYFLASISRASSQVNLYGSWQKAFTFLESFYSYLHVINLLLDSLMNWLPFKDMPESFMLNSSFSLSWGLVVMFHFLVKLPHWSLLTIPIYGCLKSPSEWSFSKWCNS